MKSNEEKENEMNEFFTWEALLTYSGATLATSLITEAIKSVGVLSRIPTRIVSYAIAFLLLMLSALFTAGLTLESAALALVNAAVVSLAANGAFDAVKSTKKE